MVALVTVVGNGTEVGCPEVSREVCAVPLVLCVMEMVADCTADVVNDVNELFGTLVVVVVVDVSLMTSVVVEVSPTLEGELAVVDVWLKAEVKDDVAVVEVWLEADVMDEPADTMVEELVEEPMEALVVAELEGKLAEGLDELLEDVELVTETIELDEVGTGVPVEVLDIATVAVELGSFQVGNGHVSDVHGGCELDHHLAAGVDEKLVTTVVLTMVSAPLVNVTSSVKVGYATWTCSSAVS